MNGFITRRTINPKFQLVHPGKLAENQLARSQHLLVTDERTSVKIFTVQHEQLGTRVYLKSLTFLFFVSRAVIGELDDETDNALDLHSIRAEPLNPIVH